MHIVEFIGRLLLSALFLIEGFGKISMQENVIMYMEDYGVPGVLFVPAIVLEILFPLLLIVGYKTKWAASVMALFTFTVAIIFHTDFSEGMQMIFFLKDLAIAGGFMIILVYGPGKISLDHYFKSKQE
jgi:putative oxidoreductase|tara:strand:- start:164 stop:547 length:384 start_codon:yes stop_codon:yes gene_type:complete